MRTLNKDYQRRDEIIFGRPLALDKYLGGCKYFEVLPLKKLGQLLDEEFADPEEAQNLSPTIGKFYEFGKKCQYRGFNAVFFGYVVSPSRGDYRTSIDAIEVTGINIDEDFVREFQELLTSSPP